MSYNSTVKILRMYVLNQRYVEMPNKKHSGHLIKLECYLIFFMISLLGINRGINYLISK